MKQFTKFIIGTLLLLPLLISAQTGPAGVGSSSSNILWVRSEDLSSLANGDRIATWADNSGNSNDLTQSDNLFKPEYVTNVQNGFPVVRFNQSNGRIRKTSFNDFPTSAITVFVVNKNNNESNDALFSYASSSANGGNDFLLFNSSNIATFRDNTNRSSSQSANDNSWHIIDVSWTSSGGDIELWKDNDSKYTNTLSDGVNITSGGCLAIAGEQDAVDGNYVSSQAHLGDFLEIIVYNIELNYAQRIIVGNYIAAKYNLTISNDFYAYQGSYSHDLAGIGRFNASNIHSSAQSADLITIGNASAMGANGEYLLFAHDNGSISSWSSTGSPYNTQKIARKFRIDETGDVGTVDITLNEDDLAALPAGYTKYGVMIDADGDFTSGATVYEMASSVPDYKATGVEVADGDYMCIIAIKPTVQFSSNSGSALENANASTNIELNYVPVSGVSVDYSTSNGSAISGSDYTAIASTTMNFPAGTKTQSVSVSVTDDGAGEGNEDFTINLASPSAGLNIGTNSTYTHTINDNDNTRKIYFSAASSSASEATTSVNITVEINSADGSNATTADYTVTGGTATGGGTDYTLASGTASISSGNTTTNISITINNDALDEDNETIIIELSNTSANCNLSGTDPIEHTYTINDNDDPPTIYFTNTTSSGAESVASKNIEVRLSAVSSKDISVSFSGSGTANSGSDYSISTSSPITISAGSTTKNITLSIVNDNTQESDETVILTLSGPTNATLGANTQHTYTITNDDYIGYSGPGGVGKSTNLKLWVKAEDIPGSADGDKISSWPDKSGNSNNLSQSNNTFRPYYYKNIINGYQVARFSDDNDRLIKTSFSDFPTAEITSYYVGYTTTANNDASLSYASSGSNNDYLLFGSNNVTVFRGNQRAATSINARNAWAIVGASWRNSDDKMYAYLNGQQKANTTVSASSDIIQNGCLAIGAEQDAIDDNYDVDQDYEGDMAEVFIYNVILNSAQTNIVNNYLSAKYNITMAANDKYTGDNSGNGDYDFEVIGIGSESDGVHNEAHGSGGLWIKQNSNFGNGDYLLIGHNEVGPQLYEPADDAGLTAPAIEQRWARDWYFDITNAGAMISVDLYFDFDEAEMNSASTPAGTTSNYKLIYRSGTSGNWSIIASANSKSASQLIFENISLTNGDGHYALGTIDKDASPLPIELIAFSAIKQENKVELRWTTATETNNDFFTIERSTELINWKVIGTKKGQGNSTISHSYSIFDNKPINGLSYYRLVQTDFDGTTTSSDAISINFFKEQLKVYPNPVNNKLIVESQAVIDRIYIYNQLGEQIIVSQKVNSKNYKLNTEKLSKGIYFVKVNYKDGESEMIKIVK